MKVEFTGEIVGGPNDGQAFKFTGETNETSKDWTKEEFMSRMAKLEIFGHVYTCLDYDLENDFMRVAW